MMVNYAKHLQITPQSESAEGYVMVDDVGFRKEMQVVCTSPDLIWVNESTVELGAEGSLVDELVRALVPLVEIADAYEKNDLDECRPERMRLDDAHCDLYCSRGGRSLLKLKHALHAREVVRRFMKRLMK